MDIGPAKSHPADQTPGQYAVILDAGSSGTRVYVYKWRPHAKAIKSATAKELQGLPDVRVINKATKKTHPGISTFADKPETVGSDHIKPLLDHALKHIPKESQSETPFFLLATAGMRLLPDLDRQAILDRVCEYARDHSPLQVSECDISVEVIPGDVEGLYGWMASNYLLGGFNDAEHHQHGGGHHTYGFLEMGGASAQLAFVPNATESTKHAEDLKLLRLRKINGEDDEYHLFTTTWLGFGVNQARSRYVETLQNSTDADILELPDPCLPSGLKLTPAGKSITAEAKHSQYLLGTGDFSQCLKSTHPLLEKDKPCDDDPCLLGGKHVPAIDFHINHFVGVSEYWHTTHEIFEMFEDDKAYDLHTYQSRVNAFCSQSWEAIAESVKEHKYGKKVDEIVAEEVCFKASWLINMLHEGIGIPRVGIEISPTEGQNLSQPLVDGAKKKGFLDPFQAVDTISGTEVSWTLGKAVLYASSQVPPSSEPLPVGFGSNFPGIAVPHDFQRPGSIDAMPGSYEKDGDWSSELFTDSPRRVPGLLLFAFIICIGVYFLCGRDRRQAIFQRCCLACGRRSRRSGSGSRLSKLFGSSGPSYERVAPGILEPQNGFEMPDYHSDEEGDVEAQASGWATPKRLVGDLVRAESRDHLGALRAESRIHRSRSPIVKLSQD